MCAVPALTDIAPEAAREAAVTGAVRGYTLALSWSPQYCRGRDRADDDSQCAQHFGFIVHGLWPEGANGQLAYCAPPAPVPAAVARAQFCAMPSARLIAHEWARHGTCASRTPADYFAASRKLYDRLRFPDMTALSYRRSDVGAFKRTLAALNPGVPPSAITVTTDRQGDWLREVRVCLGTDLSALSCPRGRSAGAPDGTPLKIWRGAR